jgi:Ubiquitin carboxyl-terminal hydrolase, family 1
MRTIGPTNVATQSNLKSFIPFGSGPSVLNDLMYGIGISSSLASTDVWSIDDPIQLMPILRPIFVLLLVLPTSEENQRHRKSTSVPIGIAEDSRGEEVIRI